MLYTCNAAQELHPVSTLGCCPRPASAPRNLGLIERRLYQDQPKRYAYCVTDKTRELDRMMLMLRLWGMRHCGLDPNVESAVTMKHRRTGKLIDAHWLPDTEDLPFSFSQVDSRVNPAWAAERASRAEVFAEGRRIRVSKRAPAKKEVGHLGKASERKESAAQAQNRCRGGLTEDWYDALVPPAKYQCPRRTCISSDRLYRPEPDLHSIGPQIGQFRMNIARDQLY
ncbi:hypothetical protein LMG27952_05083 [Paraburkholderia hiiakae]|uniref:HTH hxlR-type domain-containing protein n=1 Tax=Paraburkholderia hiiakae TaxID=1081782 RepID=A0ABM8NZM3_9BURK|nr:winged helix-turn-helix transcriptional regulator [Paraburkholderia hiiakae]CAD6550868.1 hypothetical protein LMG27952_05083 [Paraburkholderia hiiakae]